MPCCGSAVSRYCPFRPCTPRQVESGKPFENEYIEGFNGRLRQECLEENLFTSLEDAKMKIEAWRKDYNEHRPHSSIWRNSYGHRHQYTNHGRRRAGRAHCRGVSFPHGRGRWVPLPLHPGLHEPHPGREELLFRPDHGCPRSCGPGGRGYPACPRTGTPHALPAGAPSGRDRLGRYPDRRGDGTGHGCSAEGACRIRR
ncbi:MAG: transposase [Deltaproteobacteria bacterium]|nr:MAG: transposase [Deltaproteobacteria bacterium]